MSIASEGYRLLVTALLEKRGYVELEERMKHMGKLQKRLLLWLSKEEGLETPAAILKRWPEHRVLHWPPGGLATITGWVDQMMASVKELDRIYAEEPHAKYLRREYLESVDPPGVRWSAERFLGHPPKRSDSATLSKSLSDLEERGLVKTYKVKGKRQRTSHISITREGATAAELIRRKRAGER